MKVFTRKVDKLIKTKSKTVRNLMCSVTQFSLSCLCVLDVGGRVGGGVGGVLSQGLVGGPLGTVENSVSIFPKHFVSNVFHRNVLEDMTTNHPFYVPDVRSYLER